MAPSWMDDPTDKDGLLLKYWFWCGDNNTNFTNIVSDRWNLINGMKLSGALVEHLSSWRYALTTIVLKPINRNSASYIMDIFMFYHLACSCLVKAVDRVGSGLISVKIQV